MIKCFECNKNFKRVTNTHLLNKHGILMEKYLETYPNIKISIPMLSESKDKISKIKKSQYENLALREKISKKTKIGMRKFESWFKFKNYIKNRNYKGNKNPFYGKKHTEEFKKSISKNDVRNKKISIKRLSWWDGKRGKSIDEIYGMEVAFNIKEKRLLTLKNCNNIGRGISGNYKGVFFRSIWEYSFLKYLESIKININDKKQLMYEPFSIKYRFKNHTRNYYPDFLLNKSVLIEIKSKYELMKEDRRVINIEKFKAARIFCKNKNLIFKVLTEKHFPIITHKIAKKDPNIIWALLNK